MKPAKYRLAVTDLDGTLVPYGSDLVSERTVQAIRALQQNGTRFTIATGRSWKQTQPLVNRLEITCPVIVQAGALIIDPGSERVIRTQPLRPELEIQLRQLGLDGKVDQFCLSEDGDYYATRINTSGGDWLYHFGENCSLVAKWCHRPTEIIKHLFIGAEQELQRLGRIITAQITPSPRLIFWPPDPGQTIGDWFLEVFDPLASKGQALRWLTAELGIGMETVLAFGDGGNDLDMLQEAGLGVAIHGSPSEVLAVADYVAEQPENDGVARFLQSVTEQNEGLGRYDDGL